VATRHSAPASLACIATALAVVAGLFSFAGCGKRRNAETASPAGAPGVAAPAAPGPGGPPPPSPDQGFVDVADAAGILFTHSFGDGDLSNLVESVGGGAAFVDYDQDGWLDVYLVSAGYHEEVSDGEALDPAPTNRLFHNEHDGTFRDVTEAAGVGDTAFGMGVCVGDYDNDGYPDLYITNHGPNTLYHNSGDGSFAEVASRAGVDDPGCGVGATWLDYDSDGLLDLYVGNYIVFDPEYRQYYSPDRMPGPLGYAAQPDVLYRNLGDGTFADVTASSGMAVQPGRAMGLSSGDLNQDGDIDLCVANDGTPNFLFVNMGGRFEERAGLAGVSYGESGEATVAMGVDMADYDRDGLMDLLVSDDAFSSLYHQVEDGRFRDMTAPAGLAQVSGQFVSWGAGFWDYNNDGLLDVAMVNGDLHRLEGQEDCVLRGDGLGGFEDVSRELGACFDRSLVGRGCAFGDYDNDGDVDLLVQNLGGQAELLRNDVPDKGHWLTVRLVGSVSNRDGIGARVTVSYAGERAIALRRGARGYLSQSDPRLHFGLGEASKVDYIEVVWPSGTVQHIGENAVDQIITIEEPRA